MKKIKVNLLKNSYTVFVDKNSLSQLVEDLNSSSCSKCLFVIDKNVDKYHSKLIRNLVASIDKQNYKYLFNATEKNKTLSEVDKIYKFLSENFFTRDSAIVSIGGGITGDLAAFAASTYMRGINLYQVPTTLLSMVDSSVGGKTGVNYKSKKNLIGSFYQPKGVYVNPDFLTSLTDREIISGAGEIFKYSFLADFEINNLIKKSLYKIFNKDLNDIEKTILACVKIKAGIVEKDETESSGLRKILNLGHTFAHAFESVSGFRLKHGEAVIGGIYCALFLSESIGYLDSKLLDKFISDFNFIRINKILKTIDEEMIYDKMHSDKKNIGNKIRLVLLQDIGSIVVDVHSEKKVIIGSFKRMKELI